MTSCVIARLRRAFATAVVLGVACHAQAGEPLLLNADTIDRARVEPLLVLPDGTTVAIAPAAATIDAPAQSVFLYQSNTGAFTDLADFSIRERADYVCATAPIEQYDPSTSSGFDRSDLSEGSADYVQQHARLRAIDHDIEPVRCHGAPQANLSRIGYDFGDATAPTAATFQIVNSGDATLLVGTLDVAAPFAAQSDNCGGGSVGAGASCSFQILFSPPTLGRFLGTVTIRSNDPLRLTQTILVRGGFDDHLFANGFD
ncbi:MAG TPA: hypothetical protein VF132_10070 [Rudaea sp.]